MKTPSAPKTILLVEDEEMVRLLAKKVLLRNGYQVLDASGGKEALELCKRHGGPIHLLLTDVVMPEMNGKQLFERLRETKPLMKVIFMSGYTQDIIAQHGVIDERIHFIGKPFDIASLTRKIEEVLNS